MAYYQGDYYQGDYYQGDPFLGSLFAKGVSWLGKKIFKRKLSPVGQTELARRTSALAGRVATGGAVAGITVGAFPGQISIPGTPFQVSPRSFLPGGKPLFSRQQTVAPMGLAGQQMAGCCPSGFHLSKDGSGRCVRNRSMNVANPRALRRSLRRVAGFGKLAQRSKKDIRRAAKAIGA